MTRHSSRHFLLPTILALRPTFCQVGRASIQTFLPASTQQTRLGYREAMNTAPITGKRHNINGAMCRITTSLYSVIFYFDDRALQNIIQTHHHSRHDTLFQVALSIPHHSLAFRAQSVREKLANLTILHSCITTWTRPCARKRKLP